MNLIVIIVLIVSNTGYYERLNSWSIEQFKKPIFNGREALWQSGVDQLKQHLLFGTKKIGNGWHNSATHYACMTSTKYNRVGVGIAADSEGYLYWVAIFMD